MEEFYKISKEQGDLLGYVQYDNHHAVDFRVGHQKDGSYCLTTSVVDAVLEKLEGKASREIDKIKTAFVNLKKTNKIDRSTFDQNRKVNQI